MEVNWTDIESIINNYYKPIYRYCYRMMRNKEDAEDMVQEIFIKISNILESKKNITLHNNYLYKMAHNQCVDTIRRSKLIRFISYEKSGMENLQYKKVIYFEDEPSEELSKVMLSLNREERSLLILRAIEEMNYNENISYSQMLKDIKESFYGKVVEYLDINDNDGGFQLVEYEESEEERERQEKFNEIDIGSIYIEIQDQLDPGESAILAHLEMYDIDRSTFTVQQPLIFNDIEAIKEYGLDIAMPDYIPSGYKFDRATLDFVGKDYDKIRVRREELIEEAREKNLSFLWERLEDIKEFSLRVYYEPKEGENAGYKEISVYINLTEHPDVNQSLVKEGTNYEVDILTIGDKEVMRYTNDGDDIFNNYVFKIPNRQYKTYEIWAYKDDNLPFGELEKMIKSFK